MKRFGAYWFNYVFRFHGDKVNYLRWLGARIGADCSILNSVGGFSEPWLIEIGDNVTIATGVLLITHDGGSRLFRHEIPGANPLFGNGFGTIVIHANCFIGANSIVLPNVVIGPNSILGAGSVLTKVVPPGYVYAGNPAHEISTLEEYRSKYVRAMMPVISTDRNALRKELTARLWGKQR